MSGQVGGYSIVRGTLGACWRSRKVDQIVVVVVVTIRVVVVHARELMMGSGWCHKFGGRRCCWSCCLSDDHYGKIGHLLQDGNKESSRIIVVRYQTNALGQFLRNVGICGRPQRGWSIRCGIHFLQVIIQNLPLRQSGSMIQRPDVGAFQQGSSGDELTTTCGQQGRHNGFIFQGMKGTGRIRHDATPFQEGQPSFRHAHLQGMQLHAVRRMPCVPNLGILAQSPIATAGDIANDAIVRLCWTKR
mmetsp:Transcript_35899/g.74655  ORF Transcript_35899/g.74655 Transcript_35899/m.74655 type:complete len:245 (+) Transcript_35899:994-1728(+)